MIMVYQQHYLSALKFWVPYSWHCCFYLLAFYITCTYIPQSWSAISGNCSSGQGETSIQPPLKRLFNSSTLQCQEGFSCSAMGNASFCLPVCGHWAQYPHGTVMSIDVAIDVAIISSAVIGVITSIAVLVISFIRWKSMYVWLTKCHALRAPLTHQIRWWEYSLIARLYLHLVESLNWSKATGTGHVTLHTQQCK